MTSKIYKKKMICKPCKNLHPLGIQCRLGFNLGKDEFAQTVPMYTVVTNKKCNYKDMTS